MASFNTRLREALSDSGVSQQQLADRLEVGKSLVSLYVSGQRTPNDLIKYEKMGKILDVNPAWLAGFDIPKDLTAKDIQFLEEYKKLNDSAKEIIDATLRAFSLKKENQKLA